MKYQVIFLDFGEVEVPYEKLFNSYNEASNWVETIQSLPDDEDELEAYYEYYNPEDKNKYQSYLIKPIEQPLDESLLKMQKLAGIITEQEYNTLIKEEKRRGLDEWINNLITQTEELKQLMRKKGYDV